jgi:hypothetical protein
VGVGGEFARTPEEGLFVLDVVFHYPISIPEPLMNGKVIFLNLLVAIIEFVIDHRKDISDERDLIKTSV